MNRLMPNIQQATTPELKIELKLKFKFRNIARPSTPLKLTSAYKKTAQKTPPL